MARYDTTLEASGAEHLVVGRLLIERLQAFKAHANQAGYDLMVVDPISKKSLKLQVKSRIAVDSGSSGVKSFDFDFIVFVRLNRGRKRQLKEGSFEGLAEPQFFIVPKDDLQHEFKEVPFKISPGWLRAHPEYLDAWHSIKASLIGQMDRK